MPIPQPKDRESFDAFMQRCIPAMIRDGKPSNQAAGICSTSWDEYKKMKKKEGKK